LAVPVAAVPAPVVFAPVDPPAAYLPFFFADYTLVTKIS
jgi:hypothetical protein